jgi:predicted kinase
VLRFYLVYRAMVRAKVAVIRLSQPALDEPARQSARAEYHSYIELAGRYARAPRPWLAITHGPSGAGKTWITQRLIESTDAVRVRSDVERKRLHGLAPLARSRSEPGGGLYTPQASERTYARLAGLAEAALDAGHAVIVDAAFLKRAQRDQLRAVAARHGTPFHVLDIQAPETLLRARVRQREQQANDASEAGSAVLEQQLAGREPLGVDEQAETLPVSNDASADLDARIAQLAQRLAQH